MSATPPRIYVWLVPSEHVQEQPGSWRIRKWDLEYFPEANLTLGGADVEEDAERYRWFRDQAGLNRQIDILEYSEGVPDMLDHHIDKGRCGL